MAVTDRLDPHELHVMKYKRFSPLLSSVSATLQVLQVTYSTLLNIKVSEQSKTHGWDPGWGMGAPRTDVFAQNILNLLLLKTTLDN